MPIDYAPYIKQDRTVIISVRHANKRLRLLHRDPEFLAELSIQCPERMFPRFKLTAWELP